MNLGWRFQRPLIFACILLVTKITVLNPALAWGDEGHEIVALIAERYLNAAARAKVILLLAGDTDTLTDHDIASVATWADKYRDSDRCRYRRGPQGLAVPHRARTQGGSAGRPRHEPIRRLVHDPPPRQGGRHRGRNRILSLPQPCNAATVS
jgi:hypothetical protein